MANRTESDNGVMSNAKPDLFKWHGTEFIFIPLMMATGILGNALVLYITHCRWKSAIFSFFIKILAWLDVTNLMLALPTLLAITVDSNMSAFLPLCRLTSFVALFTAITSSLVLVVIAANRFRKLCQSSRSQVTLPLAKKLTVACVALGIAVSTPVIWVFDRRTASFKGELGPVNISSCFIADDVFMPLLMAWAGVLGVMFSAVSASLVMLYGHTIRALRQHDQRIVSMGRRPSAVSNNSNKKVSKKHTWVFILVTVVFFVTYSPFLFTVVLLIAKPNIESTMGPVAKAFFDLAKCCPLLSNMSNPIIYSFTSDKFNEECRKVFKLRPCMRMLNIKRKGSVTVSVEMSQSEDT